ncbi:MAG TPA: dihydropteroate synthase [Candidatus Limnocylindrales bacterium]|nr:dihydropteroate synthase [Candidatus Limnocylindrales bacterium]
MTGDHPAPIEIRGAPFAWGSRTYVMGVLNVTPDSFSGDGLLAGSEAGVVRAVDHASRMVADGADILDIGGESTRPGHHPVDADEERRRVVPVVAAVRAALPAIPISIDTTKAAVADAALDAGADVINDVHGTRGDAELFAVAARRRVPIVLMHGRPEADHGDVVPEVLAELEAALDAAVAAGVPDAQLLVDPGIGFGKTPDQNLALLARLGELRALGRPIVLGTSRKSTLGLLTGLPPAERVEATVATTVLGVAAGVDIVRVHDVRANRRAALTADAIVRGWRPAGWEESRR